MEHEKNYNKKNKFKYFNGYLRFSEIGIIYFLSVSSNFVFIIYETYETSHKN